MQILKHGFAILLATMLVACGGGGGSAGTTVTSSGTSTGTSTTATGTSTTGDISTTATGSIAVTVLSGAGVSTNSISAVEIAQVSVVVKDSKGVAVPGVVVTFSETGSLLSFAPASKTALTDAAGLAKIEIRAAVASNIGATTVGAAATVSGTSVSAFKSISISSAPAGGGVVNPQTLANALNFLDVNPSDRSIVLAGSGGNGRSESASLRFRVVDANNTPVQGVTVSFVVVPAADVTLNIPSATSDAEGVVVTTVSSKNVATAVVVNATVLGRSITSQSDQLLVTTGVATAAGFDLSASKYNLNYQVTGDSAVVTVRIVDANGNPVANGVPVVFTANYGAVGTSSQGGCSTIDGLCTVNYSVQNPRPPDGALASVTASTRVGDGTTISDIIQFQVSQPSLLNLYSASTGGTPIPSFDLGGVCKKTFIVFVGTPNNFPAPANTSITLTSLTTDLGGSVKTGSPVLDTLTFGVRTQASIEIDASALPACTPGGAGIGTGQVEIKFTAGTIVYTRNVNVIYPD